MKNNRKNMGGFALFEILFFVLLVAVLIGGAYYVGKNHNDKSKSTASSTSTSGSSSTAPAGWKLYQNKTYGFQFYYPGKWGNLNDEGNIATSSSFGYSTSYGGSAQNLIAWSTDKKKMYFVPDDQKYDSSGKPIYTDEVTKQTNFNDREATLVTTTDQTSIYKTEGNGAFNCGSEHVIFPIKDRMVDITVGGCGDPSGDNPEQMKDIKDPYRFTQLNSDILEISKHITTS